MIEALRGSQAALSWLQPKPSPESKDGSAPGFIRVNVLAQVGSSISKIVALGLAWIDISLNLSFGIGFKSLKMTILKSLNSSDYLLWSVIVNVFPGMSGILTFVIYTLKIKL